MENGLIKVFRLLKYAFNVIIVLKGTQDPHREVRRHAEKNRYPYRRDKSQNRLRPF